MQVSSKRRGLLGANDIHLAGTLAKKISHMLQHVQQISKGKRAVALLNSVTCTMQQLSLAHNDPHRRQAVMNDLARNVLGAEMVQLAPMKAVRISEGWDYVPPNDQVRNSLGSPRVFMCGSGGDPFGHVKSSLEDARPPLSPPAKSSAAARTVSFLTAIDSVRPLKCDSEMCYT